MSNREGGDYDWDILTDPEIDILRNWLNDESYSSTENWVKKLRKSGFLNGNSNMVDN
jgi:hypothetical protein